MYDSQDLPHDFAILDCNGHNGSVAWHLFADLEEFQAMKEVAFQELGQFITFRIYIYFNSFHIAKIIN